MALRPMQTVSPIGQFDAVDSQVTSFLGGEVVTFGSASVTGSDLSAADITDGYFGTTTKKRPAVTKSLSFGARPLYLVDEGIKFYGTLFGSVVGGQAGQVVTGGAVLGPHTATGSGKATLWGPGLYGITLDALDTTPGTGVTVDNSTITQGTALYATSNGLLTPVLGSAFEAVVVARFIEFMTDGSLVTTTKGQISALNSPTGQAADRLGFTQAVIAFAVGQ